MYQVTFFDGNIRDFAANTIAKAIYTRHDDEGNQVYTHKGDHWQWEIAECHFERRRMDHIIQLEQK